MKVNLCLLCVSLFSSLMTQELQAKKVSADYVIVGVGTAGAVLAKKLSDDKKTSVVALHIGENLVEDPIIKFVEFTPITVGSAIIGPPFYINGDSVPQVFANDRELLWVLSLPLGGASSVNAGAYCRATNQVNAQWEFLAGPNWSVDRILNVYKELEKYNGETTDPAARGYHGPLDIRQTPNPTQVSLTFTEAVMDATGVPFVLDYNDPQTPIGASSQVQYTQNGPAGELRVSSATAFLNEKVMTPNGIGVKGRKLKVLFESRGLKAIWKGNKAVGVEYLHSGEVKRIFAKKGVVVSAGLMSSPFLLHSGVGSRTLLESLNIPVVFDNPNVGQGLADQPGIRCLFTSNPLDTPLNSPSGLFSQIAWLPSPTGGGNPEKREARLATINLFPGVTLGLFDLAQPLSRGSVSIDSADPLSPPVVNTGILSNSSDLTLFQQVFQIYVKNINLALQAIDPLYRLIFPDPAILDDLELLTFFIKETVASNQHFQSHCRMAPIELGGVVDSTGHVYGVKNLIVADDSIVPQNMDGSPMATAYLIGSNIADLLIENDRKRCK